LGKSLTLTSLPWKIWTDGSVKPDDALAYAAKILKDQLNIFINFEEEAETPEEEVKV